MNSPTASRGGGKASRRSFRHGSAPSATYVLRASGVVAAAGLGGALVAAFFSEGGLDRLLQTYLVSFAFILSLALGGLFFVLLQHVTRAGWSVVVRRLAEHAMATVPLFAVLFVPIWFWRHRCQQSS